MDLRNQQIKETYGNLATINTVAGTPTTGVLQNGAGSNVTTLTISGTLDATNVDATNLTGTLTGNVVATNLTGTLQTAAQTNITSVGTLTGLTVSGDANFDSGTLFVDVSADSVGIGTSSPSSPLTLQSNTSADSLRFVGRSLNDETRVDFYDNADTTPQMYITSATTINTIQSLSTRPLALFTNSQERLRIDSSGNVGIGTSSPSSAGSGYTGLDIRGSGGGSIRYGVTSGFNMLTYATGTATDFVPSAASDIRFFNKTGVTESIRFQSGGGISFNGDTAAANALDDYEQGTFTPTVYGGTTAGTTTYVTQNGTYTKIGRLINVTLKVEYSAATGTGAMLIGGLPVAITQSGYEAFGSVMTSGLNWSGGTMLTSYISSGENRLSIYGSSDDGVITAQSVVNESAAIWVSITYFAA